MTRQNPYNALIAENYFPLGVKGVLMACYWPLGFSRVLALDFGTPNDDVIGISHNDLTVLQNIRS